MPPCVRITFRSHLPRTKTAITGRVHYNNHMILYYNIILYTREQKKKNHGISANLLNRFSGDMFFLHIFLQAPSLLFIIYTYYYTLVSIYKRPSYTRCVFAVGPRVKNKTRGAQFSITRTPIYCVLWWFFTLFFILFCVHKTSLVNDFEKLIGV